MSASLKTIVITGCSTGFGRATALRLARHGWRVFATVRKEVDRASLLVEAMAQGSAERLTLVLCDITHAGQVKDLSRTVRQATPQLNALLNNAGTAFPAPLEMLALDDLRAQLELNVVAQLGVTQPLLPLLKAAHGTIINVSSQGGKIVLPVTGAYHISKFALEAMSDVLRIELAPFGVRVVVIEPGASPTAIWETSRQRGMARLEEHQEQASAYEPLISAINGYFISSSTQGFPPQRFADLVLKILDSPQPRARYALPRQAAVMITLRRFLPDAVWDWFVRRRLKW